MDVYLPSFMFTSLRLGPLILRREGLHCVSHIISRMPCTYSFVQPVALAFAYNTRHISVCDTSPPGGAWKRGGSGASVFPRAYH